MSGNGCRRCLTQKTMLTTTEDEVRRIARQMARASRPSQMASLKDQLIIAKAAVADAKVVIERGHDCDTRLTDEHWTKRLA